MTMNESVFVSIKPRNTDRKHADFVLLDTSAKSMTLDQIMDKALDAVQIYQRDNSGYAIVSTYDYRIGFFYRTPTGWRKGNDNYGLRYYDRYVCEYLEELRAATAAQAETR